MKDIVLIGSGGLAREIAWIIEENNKIEKSWNILGFISNGNRIYSSYPILGNDEWLLNYPAKINVVCCIGNPMLRKRILDKYITKENIIFPNIISKDAIVSDRVKFSKGSIVCAGSVLTVDIEVGNFVVCNLNCTIGHDTVIEDYVSLNPSVNISGNVKIKKGVEMGTNSSVIQNIIIGENSIIGAGATVIRDIPSNCTAVGVPAKVIKYNKEN